jgi:short-subunit dehydrogenase
MRTRPSEVCVHSASWVFLTTFSLALEQELRDVRVLVVTVCPGRLRKTQNGGPDQVR